MEPTANDVMFFAPGPGEWTIDRSHFPGETTPIVESLISEGSRRGFTQVFATTLGERPSNEVVQRCNDTIRPR